MKTEQFLYIFIILLVLQLSSCNQVRNERKSSSITQVEKLNLEKEDIKQMTWYADWDSVLMDIVFKEGEKFDSVKKDQKKLIELLNRYKQIEIEFLRLAGDTIFVNVKNDEVLTEQLGTCGADEYLGIVVLTLTEIKGIGKVNFDFEEGSHASPGTYSRQSFLTKKNKYRLVTKAKLSWALMRRMKVL